MTVVLFIALILVSLVLIVTVLMQQGQRQGTHQRAAEQQTALIEYPNSAVQQHLPGITAYHQTNEHGNHIAVQQTEYSLENRTHSQSEQYQKHRHGLLEGQKISGAFQLAAAVQHHCQRREHKTHSRHPANILPEFPDQS